MAYVISILRRAVDPPLPFWLFGRLFSMSRLKFFAPVYMGLAFTQYGFDKFAPSRGELLK